MREAILLTRIIRARFFLIVACLKFLRLFQEVATRVIIESKMYFVILPGGKQVLGSKPDYRIYRVVKIQ